MEYRRCRICLDDREQSTLVSPCGCRGSVGYIHADCLQDYLTYYPDHMCRICMTRIPSPMTMTERLISIAILGMLGNMIVLSDMPSMGKLAMVGLVIGVTWYYTLARLWVWWVLAGVSTIAFLFGVGGNPIAMMITALNLVLVAFVWTLSMYIPRIYLAAAFAILVSFGSIGFLTAMALLNVDPIGSAAILMFLFLAWVAWLDSHPETVRFGMD